MGPAIAFGRRAAQQGPATSDGEGRRSKRKTPAIPLCRRGFYVKLLGEE
jgi:hypothetical protein